MAFLVRPLSSVLFSVSRTGAVRLLTMTSAAVVHAMLSLCVGPSLAENVAPMPGGIGQTSPLGAGLETGMPQSAGISSATDANLAPCTTSNAGTPALPTFDGGGLSLSTNATTPALASASGMKIKVGPCNAVGPSGVATTSSSPSSALSGAPDSLEAAGVAGLGSGGLGTTGLGAVRLGSLPGATTSQARPPSTGVAGSSTFCSGASGGGVAASSNASADTSAMTNPMMNAGGTSASSIVRDPALGVGTALRDPAQSLAGEASLQTTNAAGAPCMIGE